MNTLKINVAGRRMSVVDGDAPNTGGKNYDAAAFTLDGEWDGKNAVALFWQGDGDKTSVVLDNTRTCAIPSSVLQDSHMRLKIGIVGFDAASVDSATTVISSDVLSVRLDEGAAEGKWNTETVADTLYEQLLASCVIKEAGKGLSSNDYTDAEKAAVATIADKVDKAAGKSLSTNDYTNEDKAIVSGHAADIEALQEACNDLNTGKVDKVSGKGLSANDYTNDEKAKVAEAVPNSKVLSVSSYTPYVTMVNATLDYPIVRNGSVTSLIFQVRGNGSIDFEIYADTPIGVGRSDFTGLTAWTDIDLFAGNPNSNLTNIRIIATGTFDVRVLDDPATASFISAAEQTIGCDYVENMDGEHIPAADLMSLLLDKKVDKISGKGLSANDYTNADKAIVAGHEADVATLQEACDALEAGKLDLPLYDMANNNADTLTTPGIYATSYAGPQNFPSIDPDAMPLLIVAEAGRMPDTSGGAPDFSNSKTLLQILIYNSGRIYSRYKIAGDGDMADWSWSAWSTKGSTNDYTNADKAIVSDVGRKWRKLADTTLTEAVGSVTFSEDMDGAAFSCTNFRIFIKYPTIEGQTGKSSLKMTSSSLQATHYISFYNALVAGDTYNETIKINLDIFSDVVDVLWFVGQEPAISSPASIMSSIRNGVIKCPSGAISDLTIACATSGWTLPVGTEIRIYGR
jgi:hypothetical protein